MQIAGNNCSGPVQGASHSQYQGVTGSHPLFPKFSQALWLGIMFLFACLVNLQALTLEPMVRTFEKEGGGAAIIVSGSGSWTATTTDAWINITPTTSGNGDGIVSYLVSANRTASQRVGKITIGGVTHTVYQNGYSASINPTEAGFDSAGGSGTVSVTVDSGIAWDARSNADWITVTAGASGAGNGSVTYSVQSYTTSVATRTGTLTICDNTFTVTQTGADVLLSPASAEVDDNSNIILFNINALSSTAWTITTTNDWLSILSASSGSGDAQVMLSATANFSFKARKGTISVGSKTFSVTQEGNANPVLSIDPPLSTAVAEGAYGVINVYATPDFPWIAESTDPWLTITEGASGAGDGSVRFVVSANPTLGERKGYVRIAGKYAIDAPVIASAAEEFFIQESTSEENDDSFQDPIDSEVHAAATSGDYTYEVSNKLATITKYTGNASVLSIPSTLGGYTVTSIGGSAFKGCTGLTSVTIPYGVTSIGQSAFYGCTGLTSMTLPNSVTSIADSTFYGCTGLTSVTLPNSVTSIGREAFSECSGLTSVTLPNSVTSIADSTFYGCTGLTSVTIPNSVTSIGNYAFQNCTGLRIIFFEGDAPQLGGSDVFKNCPAIIYYNPWKNNWTNPWGGKATKPAIVCIHTVTQAAMEPSLNEDGAQFDAVGGSGEVVVTLANGVLWSAKSNTSWIKVLSPEAEVSGGGKVSYTVEPNGTIYPRTGTLTISGLTFTVSQGGRGHAIDATEFSFGPDGGMGTANFTSEANATWTAVASDKWIQISEGQSGSGPSGILFITAPYTNPTTYRVGTITIGTAVITLTQYGYEASVDPLVQAIVPNGATASVNVTVPFGATWEVASRAGWITLIGGPDRTGSGVLTYIVAPNLSSGPRSGTLLIAGKEVTVTQAGGGEMEPPALSEQPQSRSVKEAESVTFSVTATGKAPLTYQWRKDGEPISGAGSATYTISGVVKADAGSYTVTVSNAAGSVTSDAAILTVQGSEPGMLYHPADTDQDSSIKIAEVTAYGRAWKKGETWAVEPNPIPIAYVTRAGILWKKGEGYALDQTQDAPLCWVSAVVSAAASSSLALSTIEGGVVTIAVTPASDVGVYAVEDAIPEGIGVTEINENGEFDSINRKVKWGPWFDNQPRSLSYTLVPGSFSGTATLQGTVSLDGVNIPIEGERTYSTVPSTDHAVCTIEGNVVTITVSPGSDIGVYAVEDTIPEGIEVTEINENGEFDSINRKVKWGPWFDNQPRTLTYTLETGSFSGLVTLNGIASFDGINVVIKGDREYNSGGTPIEAPVIAPAYFGGILIEGTVGGVYVIEYSNDNFTWILADEITLTGPSQYWVDLTSNGERLRFYRAKVKE